MKRFFILTFVFLSLCCNVALSGDMVSFDVENGLTNSRITCLTEDSMCNVWIATNNGLNRFDGNKICQYRHDDLNQVSLKHNNCSGLLVTNGGTLYVATEMGIQCYDYESDCFRTVPLIISNGDTVMASIVDMTEMNDGVVMVSTYGYGIMKLEDGVFKKMVEENTYSNTRHLFADSRDRLWMTDASGNLYLDGVILTVLPDVVSIVQGGDQTVYVASSSHGLYRFNENDLRLEKLPVADCQISRIRQGSNGQLLLCTDGHGLMVYDPKTGVLSQTPIRTYRYEFSTSNVKDALIDNFGNIWVGVYWKGVEVWPEQNSNFKYTGSRSGIRNSIGFNCITAIEPDNSLDSENHSVMWLASDQSGLYRVTDNGKSGCHYEPGQNGMPKTVMSMLRDDGDRLWLGASNVGAFLMDTRSGICTSVKSVSGSVHDIKKDGYGNLWFATNGNGLFMIRENGSSRETLHYGSLENNAVSYPYHIISNTYLSSLLFHDGYLFVGSANGMEVFTCSSSGELKKKSRLFIKHAICDIKAHADGTVWVATNNGLYHIYSDSILSKFNADHGLGDNQVNSIEIDDNDIVWAGTDHGLSRIDPASGRVTTYLSTDGLKNEEFTSRASVYVNGTMHFGGVLGMTSFRPSEISAPGSGLTETGELRILNLSAGDRRLTDPQSVRLHHRDRSFSLELSVMNPCYSKPQFSYTIDGEPAVNLPAGQNCINFSNLKSGRHSLLISEKGCDNLCNLSIRVMRPRYLSIVALFAYVMILALLVFVVMLSMRRHKADENAKRELKQEVERVRNIKRVEQLDVDSPDDQFMQRVMKIINENMSNSDMNVEFIADKVGISRAHFYRRLKQITNMSPLDFLKEIRLKEAARLLTEKNCDISDVSAATGFRYLSSFSTAFKAYWGVPPSEYMKTRH